MNMKKDWASLEGLEFAFIGSWPKSIQKLVFLGLFLLSLTGGYLFESTNQTTLALEEANEQIARTGFSKKHQDVSNIEDYRDQMNKLRKDFLTVKGQLPPTYKTEEFLEELSQKAHANHLEFASIKPLPPQTKEFYTEYPIDLLLTGDSYHRFGEFVSDIANMERIVTFHDFEIKKADKSNLLVMSASIKTYSYGASEKEALPK